MHMIARIGLIIVRTLTCVAPMDGRKVRLQEEALGRFNAACQLEDDPDVPLPQAPWSLTQEEIMLADKRRTHILAPIGFSYRSTVSMFANQTNLKSHDWFQVTKYLALYFNLFVKINLSKISTNMKATNLWNYNRRKNYRTCLYIKTREICTRVPQQYYCTRIISVS